MVKSGRILPQTGNVISQLYTLVEAVYVAETPGKADKKIPAYAGIDGRDPDCSRQIIDRCAFLLGLYQVLLAHTQCQGRSTCHVNR